MIRVVPDNDTTATLIIDINYRYRWITIKVGPGYYKLEPWEKQETWQHELVHAFLGTLDDFVQQFMHIEGVRAQYVLAVEQCTCDLTHLLIHIDKLIKDISRKTDA